MSFMGAYGPELIFPSDTPPGGQMVLPKFAIMSWLFTDIDDRPERLSLHVYGPPGKTEIFKRDFPYDASAPVIILYPDSTRFIVTMPLALMNVMIPSEGTIVVEIETERETIRAGRLRVRIDDPVANATLVAPAPNPSVPTASPPLSEQSPPDAPETKPPPARRRRATHRSGRTPELE